MSKILAGELLATIANAPRNAAANVLGYLEPEDFPEWQDQEIFQAFRQVVWADHPEPGSILIQVDRALREAGEYADRDNGLRARVYSLVTTQGHPEQLPEQAALLVEERYRRATREHFQTIADMADRAPLTDLDKAVHRAVADLRRLKARLTTPAHKPRIVPKEVA